MQDMLFIITAIISGKRQRCAPGLHNFFFPFWDRNNSDITLKCIFKDRVVKSKIIFSEPAIKIGVDTWGVKIDTWEEIIFEVWL